MVYIKLKSFLFENIWKRIQFRGSYYREEELGEKGVREREREETNKGHRQYL